MTGGRSYLEPEKLGQVEESAKNFGYSGFDSVLVHFGLQTMSLRAKAALY
jgi:hypothetical protein